MLSLCLLAVACVGSVHCALPTCVSSSSAPGGCTGPDNLQWFQDTSKNYPIKVSQITATYDGASADSQGGLDVTKNIHIAITANNQYGVVTTPMLDVTVSHCQKGWLAKKCSWSSSSFGIATLNGLLKNLDPCDASLGVSVSPNCKLAPAGTQVITLNVDLSQNAAVSAAIGVALSHNTYYELAITMREAAPGKEQVLAIVTAEDLIK